MERYTNSIITAILVIGLMLAASGSSFALLGSAAGKTAQETIEYTARKFGIEITKDAGREFSEKAGQFIARHGDDGARLLRQAGPEAMEQVAKHGDDLLRMSAAHADDALSYLVKNADEALPVWRNLGKEGTEMMLKHPGLAEPLMKEFGREGLPVARKLSSESLEKFLVLSSKAANTQEKRALFDTVLSRGDDVINFLWGHKWKIGAGATLYALLKDFDLGRTGDDTSGRPSGANLPQTMVIRAWDTMLDAYPWIVPVALALMLLWVYPIFRWLWRLPRYLRGNKDESRGQARPSLS